MFEEDLPAWEWLFSLQTAGGELSCLGSRLAFTQGPFQSQGSAKCSLWVPVVQADCRIFWVSIICPLLGGWWFCSSGQQQLPAAMWSIWHHKGQRVTVQGA